MVNKSAPTGYLMVAGSFRNSIDTKGYMANLLNIHSNFSFLFYLSEKGVKQILEWAGNNGLG